MNTQSNPVIDILEEVFRNWTNPRTPGFMRDAYPGKELLAKCTYTLPGNNLTDSSLPADVASFWTKFHKAELFKSRERIFGLDLLSIWESESRTDSWKKEVYSSYVVGDIVIGAFISGLQMLIVRCDVDSEDYGSVVITEFDAPREDWVHHFSTFYDFLVKFIEGEGKSFWEYR